MLDDIIIRSKSLLGKETIDKINKTTVIVFGLGGVGGHCAEALVRLGIKKIYIVDKDVVSPSNINRQIFAKFNNIGEDKAKVAFERLSNINPYVEIVPIKSFYLPESPVDIPDDVDMILDCIDTITAKIHLIETCSKIEKPIISCMGMGNRIDPTKIKIDKLHKTKNDPLCKVMRKLAKDRNLTNITVVYSEEIPKKCNLSDNPNKAVPGSLPFVPSVGGIIMAYHVCNSIANSIDNTPKFI